MQHLESRPDLERPPSGAVLWTVSTLVPRRCVQVMAQLWFEARARGAAELGVSVERVVCIRADERRLLTGEA